MAVVFPLSLLAIDVLLKGKLQESKSWTKFLFLLHPLFSADMPTTGKTPQEPLPRLQCLALPNGLCMPPMGL